MKKGPALIGAKPLFYLARPEGFEPPTTWFVVRYCGIQVHPIASIYANKNNANALLHASCRPVTSTMIPSEPPRKWG